MKLASYMVETVQENLRTSSSTAKEVSARIYLLQAAQFICVSRCFLNTLTWRCRIRPRVKSNVILKMHHTGNYSFHASTIIFNDVMKNEVVRKQFLNILLQNAICQKTGWVKSTGINDWLPKTPLKCTAG